LPHTRIRTLQLLKRRRVQIQSLNRQFERVISRIASCDVQIKSATLTILQVNLGDHKAISNLRTIGVIGADLPNGLGHDFAEGPHDARATARNIVIWDI
jgi:hypothetical protein